VKKAIKRLSL